MYDIINDSPKVIDLNWKEYHLSSLMKKDGKLFYKIYGKAMISAAYDNCPVEMILKKNSKTDEYREINHIPSIFSDYYVSRNRKDLRKQLNIKVDDDYFTSLYKIAQNADLFMQDGFWISEGKYDKDLTNNQTLKY